MDKRTAKEVIVKIFRQGAPKVKIRPYDIKKERFPYAKPVEMIKSPYGSSYVELEGKDYIFLVCKWWSNDALWSLTAFPFPNTPMTTRKSYSYGIFQINKLEESALFWSYVISRTRLEDVRKDTPQKQKDKIWKQKEEAWQKASVYFKTRNKKALAKGRSLEVSIPLPQNRDGRLRFFKDIFRLADDAIGADEAAINHYEKIKGVMRPKGVEETSEGGIKTLLAQHKKRERDGVFAQKQKANYWRDTNKKMPCQACGVSFLEDYGAIGEGFIEAHHLVPLHKGERKTQSGDIAMVCPNCHRMIHRHLAKNPTNPKPWLLEIKGLEKFLHRRRKK